MRLLLGLEPRRLGDLVADHGDLLISEALLVEPVGAGDFLEGVDRGLDALGPGDGWRQMGFAFPPRYDIMANVAQHAKPVRKNGEEY